MSWQQVAMASGYKLTAGQNPIRLFAHPRRYSLILLTFTWSNSMSINAETIVGIIAIFVGIPPALLVIWKLCLRRTFGQLKQRRFSSL